MKKKYKITFYDKDVTRYVSYGGRVTIRGFVNKRLLEEVKQQKREFSKKFKDWFIWMKANFDHGLAMHGDINDWWWVPAMRLQMPGVQICGIDYHIVYVLKSKTPVREALDEGPYIFRYFSMNNGHPYIELDPERAIAFHTKKNAEKFMQKHPRWNLRKFYEVCEIRTEVSTPNYYDNEEND